MNAVDPAQGVLLDSPQLEEAADERNEAPSVFSVVHRYLVGRAEVSDPLEDGSRTLRLYSPTASTIVEVVLSGELSDFLSGKLAEQVIEEDEEDEA